MTAGEASRSELGEAGRQVAVTEFCRRIESELQDLQQMAVVIQESLSPTLDVCTVADFPPKDAQILDLLTQSLEALSSIFGQLSRTVPSEWAIDPEPVAKVVVLEALANRLRGHDSAQDLLDAGQVELF